MEAKQPTRLTQEIKVGWLQDWVTKRAPRLRRPARHASGSHQDATRRHLLALALRDTLRTHGIPAAWITLEARPTASRTGSRGMHMRLAVREWEGRLPAYFVALEKEIGAALLRMDPLSASWLSGTSWRFALQDDQRCPKLPAAETWLAAPALLTMDDSQGSRAPVLAPDLHVREIRLDFLPTQPLGEAPALAALERRC